MLAATPGPQGEMTVRIVSISLAAALVTAVTFASAFAVDRWMELPAPQDPAGYNQAVRAFLAQ